MTDALEHSIAERLRVAEDMVSPIPPIAGELGASNLAAAYRVQHINTEHALTQGREFLGRKIGLTSYVVRQQMGIENPDYGALFKDMQLPNGGTLDMSDLIDPRIEAEIALIMGQDMTEPKQSPDDLAGYVAYACSAIEIVDTRIADWDISIVDTVADNASAARFVLGEERVPMKEIDLGALNVRMTRNGEHVSSGTGAATMGHPLHALGWAVNLLIEHGRPLRAGDVVLTGSLGRVARMQSGDQFEARFEGLSPVRLNVV